MPSLSRSAPRAAVLLAVCTLVFSIAEWRPHAAGTITGVVFEDFNGNGLRDTTATLVNDGGFGTTPRAVDRGVAGVQVRVFDGAGAQQGAALTDASGVYTVAAGGTGPYRVEFTQLPVGYVPSVVSPGPTGNGSTVQFVADGASGNVNLGILNPENYCRDNPTLVTSCHVFGDQMTGPSAAAPVVLDFPYSAGSNAADPNERDSYFRPSTHALGVPANAVGTVFGLGYRRSSHTIYAAAYMKKHAGFGPRGTGAIYAIDPATGTSTLYADLNAIFGPGTAGADPHLGNGGDFGRDNGDAAWDGVGKTSLGGLEVSPDGSMVFVINLADRRLYALPTSGLLTSGTVRRVDMPAAPGATGGGADLRPFALQWYRGRLYVGLVNTAQSTQQAGDLRAYVYGVTPSTLTFDAAPALQFPLAYPRGNVQLSQAGGNAAWRPWVAGFRTASPTPEALGIYPQPMLTGLAFDADGHMILGLRDRAGDQFGDGTADAPGSTTRYEAVPAGDTLVAAINTPGNPAGGWTLEANARAGALGPTAGAGNGQGPGGGEYFFDERFESFDDETSLGTVLNVPGLPDVLTSALSPGRTVHTGGFLWLREATGAKSKGYDLYIGAAAPPAAAPATFPQPPPTSVSANGLGEVVAICTAAPIEIGNRVWADLDGDGVQDPQEPGIDNVAVQLVGPDGVVLGTSTTAGGGQYYFSSAASGSVANGVYGVTGLRPNTSGYELRIALAQPSLDGRTPTVANNDATPNGDSRDSDGVATGTNDVIVLATGPAGANSHTYDFGFKQGPPIPPDPRVSLGNLVWADYNNDGRVSPGEPGLAGVTVRLFDGAGTGLLATQLTDATGHYLFDKLVPGNYVVEVVTPANLLSSTGNGSEPAPDPDNDVDNDDNGTTAGAVVRSLPVTLAVGTEPVNDGDVDPNSNLTVDFGFYPTSGDPCVEQTIPRVATPGGTVTATYTLINRGPGPIVNAFIKGEIHQYSTVELAEPSPGGSCSQSGDILDCTWPGATPPGILRSVTVRLRISPTAPHGAVIPLWFFTGNGSVYSGACTAVDTYLFVVDGKGPVADLAIASTASVGAQNGHAVAAPIDTPVQTRFVVTNTSGIAGRGQYAVQLDRSFGIQVAGATISQGWVQLTSATSAVWDTGDIPPGRTATLNVTLVPKAALVTRLQAIRVDGRPADPDATNDQTSVVVDGQDLAGWRAVAIGNVDGAPGGELVTAAGKGETPQVRVFTGSGTEARPPFFAFPRRFYGGLSIAACDVDGNGVDELVVGQGPGGGQVRVLSLATPAVTDVAAFTPFEASFTGGVNVACGDTNGDGRAEVVVGPTGGRAPDVKVYAIGGGTATQVASFTAYEASFTGGVRVAARPFTGSAAVGAFHIATLPGPGRPGDVRVWRRSGATAVMATEARVLADTSGATLTVGDVTGDGVPELIVAPDRGAPKLLQVFSLASATVLFEVPSGTAGLTAVRTAVGRLSGGPGPEVALGPSAGSVPIVGTFVIGANGAVYQRLSINALEVP